MRTKPYECQQCGGKATVQGQQAINYYESPYIAEYVVCKDCGYTIPKSAMDCAALLAVCKCAEADLMGLVLDYLDINIEDSDEPQARTIRELRNAINRAEQ